MNMDMIIIIPWSLDTINRTCKSSFMAWSSNFKSKASKNLKIKRRLAALHKYNLTPSEKRERRDLRHCTNTTWSHVIQQHSAYYQIQTNGISQNWKHGKPNSLHCTSWSWTFCSVWQYDLQLTKPYAVVSAKKLIFISSSLLDLHNIGNKKVRGRSRPRISIFLAWYNDPEPPGCRNLIKILLSLHSSCFLLGYTMQLTLDVTEIRRKSVG